MIDRLVHHAEILALKATATARPRPRPPARIGTLIDRGLAVRFAAAPKMNDWVAHFSTGTGSTSRP